MVSIHFYDFICSVKMEKCRKKHGEGNFQLRINEINALEIKEFQNPWSFHSLFISGDDIVYNWLRKNGLLASDLTCHCGKEAKLNKRNHLKDGYTFRCGSQHEFTMRKNSFFEKSSYNIRDLIIFYKISYRRAFFAPVCVKYGYGLQTYCSQLG